MTDAKKQTQVISAARFIIELDRLGRIAFSDLGGINSKVNPAEYVYNDDEGNTVHTKQFGKTDPPTISLKRGLDAEGNAKILGWHQLAREGSPEARSNGTLTVMDASGAGQIVYTLDEAWCSEVTISPMKAGDSTVATIEVKITCQQIYVPGLLGATRAA